MRIMILLISIFLSLSIYAQKVMVVDAPLEHLFIPEGFDNNDNVELVVTGSFKNPCYSSNKVDIEVKDSTIFIKVTSLARSSEKFVDCEELKIPFSETVTIGNLQAGDYNVIVNQSSSAPLTGKLTIAKSASKKVDDHIYAKVDYVELGFTGGLSGNAVLVGNTISSCLELDSVKLVSNKKDTFSILPIMKRMSHNCPEKKIRLEIPIKFDIEKLKTDKILLFVRSMEGKSVHAIIEKK